jgi:hypothetical protein
MAFLENFTFWVKLYDCADSMIVQTDRSGKRVFRKQNSNLHPLTLFCSKLHFSKKGFFSLRCCHLDRASDRARLTNRATEQLVRQLKKDSSIASGFLVRVQTLRGKCTCYFSIFTLERTEYLNMAERQHMPFIVSLRILRPVVSCLYI